MCEAVSSERGGLKVNPDAVELQSPKHATEPIYSPEPTLASVPNLVPKSGFEVAPV